MFHVSKFHVINKDFCLRLGAFLSITAVVFGHNNGEKKNQRELIVIFDADSDENKHSVKPAGSYVLSRVLSEAKVPIIVHSNLAEIVCQWQLDKEKGLEFDNKKYALHTFLKNQKEWHLFHHKDSNLVLLVPKSHLKAHCSSGALVRPGIEWYTKEYGFDIKNVERIDSSSVENILQALSDRKKRRSNNIVADFESLFDLDNKSLEWNILLTGHGNVKDYRHYKSEDEVFKDVKTNPHSSFNYTVGLPFKDFAQLFSVLQKINTTVVFYHSCFTVGSNLTAMQTILSRNNVDFIVATQGLPEEGARWNFRNRDIFFNFTKKIRSFSLDKQEENIRKATKHFIYSSDDNQLFVYMPQSKKWESFFNEKAIQIGENDNRQFCGSHIENSNIELKMGFIDVAYLRKPLYMKKDMRLISGIAQRFSQLNNRAHVIESVLSESTVAETIVNLVMHNKHYNSLTLAINELECPIAHDFGFAPSDHPQKILIHLTKKEPSWSKRACVDMDVIMSDSQGKHYFLSQEVVSYDTSKKDMVNVLRQAKVSQATKRNIKGVLSKISAKEIADNKHLAKVVDDLRPKNVWSEAMLEKESCNEEDAFLMDLSMYT